MTTDSRSLLPPAASALFQAIPRDRRLTDAHMREIGARLGLGARGVAQARNLLVRRGFLEEFPARDGSASIGSWEWRVRP